MTSSSFVQLFGKDADSVDISSRCDHLCTLFNLSRDDLFTHWESFIYTKLHNANTKLSLPNLDLLQDYIQQTLVLNNLSNNDVVPAVKRRKMAKILTVDEKGTELTPAKEKPLESINDHIPSKETTVENKKLKIYANFNPSKYKYRKMNLKLLEIADYLDEKIEIFSQILSEEHKVEFVNPLLQSQSEIHTVGRIVPDTPLNSSSTISSSTTSSSLNLDSLCLETSRMLGFGRRIKLDLSGISNRSFFPGQIVGLKGVNSDGKTLKVLEVLKTPYLGSATYQEEEVLSYAETLQGDNLKIVIANGPYHKDLNFEVFEQFVQQLNTDLKPDVLIMSGPFLDVKTIDLIVNKQFFENEDEDQDDFSDLKNLDDVFKSFMAPLLNTIKCSKVILIPHLNDIANPHSVYPQAPFNRKTLNLNKNFKCFPNPSFFNINECSVAISNIDILKDLKDIPTNDLVSSSRLERILNHIIEQRQFYPYLPASSAVDVSYLGLSEFNEEMPDLIILPSILKPFVKIYKNIVFINPGSLLKAGGSSGTFTKLEISGPNPDPNTGNLKAIEHAADEDTEEITESYISTLWERAKVGIYNV